MDRKKKILLFAAAAFCCIAAVFAATADSRRTIPSSSRDAVSSRLSPEPPRSSAAEALPSSVGASSEEELYWLHKSEMKPPEKSACLRAQKQALKGLKEAQLETVWDTVREEHVRIEYCLMDRVKSLKSPDAPYWEFLEHTGTIAIPGEEVVWNEWDKDTIKANLNKAGNLIEDSGVKSDFRRMRETLDDAVGRHNLRGLFSYHEMIHDYDCWVVNYPAHYPEAPAPDWGGIGVYFGIPCVLSGAAAQ